MGTAVCLQEWQSSLWDKRRGGAALNYSIQIYTELSEIIHITYVNNDSLSFKRVTTIISSYFGSFFLETVWPVFMSVSPRSDCESSLERFQRIWVIFSVPAAERCFSIARTCKFILPLSRTVKLRICLSVHPHHLLTWCLITHITHLYA